jgi:polar amino acid transport system substrate-binding protein
MKKLIVVLVVLAFVVGASPLMASSLKIGSYPIPKMVESKDKGVFVDLTKEVAKRAGVSFELELAPPPRTVESFSKGMIDGFFPALDVLISGPVAKSAPIYTKVDFAFFKKGATNLKTIAELEGKKVGITRGYPYDAALMSNKKIIFDPADDDVTNMKKLAAGRIDAFVVEEKSGLEALKKSGETTITYDSGKPLSKQAVYYAFKKSADGQKAADGFSKALEEMKKDGTFGKIMSQAN